MKIFRDFRANSLIGKKFTSYSIYAAGEILLIIIGILIALKINNWNEVINLRKEEAVLLVNLKSEFAVNLENLKNIHGNNKSIYESNLVLKTLIGEDRSKISQYNVDSLLLNSIMLYDFQPSQFILSQLKSSDKIETIRSETVRRLIYEWDNTLNAKAEAFNMWNTYFMNSFIPFLDDYASIRNIDYYGDYSWSSLSPLANNTIGMFDMIGFDNRLENHMWCLNAFNESIEKLISISEKIDEEINKENLK